jgi:hypothetical protein
MYIIIGAVGAGGILIDLGGQVELYFAWALGISSNNKAKAYALLPGLRMTLDL